MLKFDAGSSAEDSRAAHLEYSIASATVERFTSTFAVARAREYLPRSGAQEKKTTTLFVKRS